METTCHFCDAVSIRCAVPNYLDSYALQDTPYFDGIIVSTESNQSPAAIVVSAPLRFEVTQVQMPTFKKIVVAVFGYQKHRTLAVP